MKVHKGDKVILTEETKNHFGLPDGVEYTVVDVLYDNVPYNIVLNAEEFGKDWVQYFDEDEIILI